MHQVVVFVPIDFKEEVKDAMFQAGGGKMGNYDSCSFELEGLGQFRPLVGSRPFLGSVEKLELVAEVRIEMTCEDDHVENVLKAIKASHPYETPAFYAIKTLGL